MALKVKTVKTIDVADWDKLVVETYGRPYDLQQQDGCMGRGGVDLTVPDDEDEDEYMHPAADIPEVVNGRVMGVRFADWLARDPKKPIPGKDGGEKYMLDLFWHRTFYPDLQTVANDLCKRGLLKKGKYVIDIDW
jgi:hypothetical protein